MIIQKERKKDGTARKCDMCIRRKPDRTHHCKLCDSCVLKMDHHCPWIANCVGYYNYKFFLLLIIYGSFSLIIFTTTFWEALYVSVHSNQYSPYLCFFLTVTYSLGSLLGVVVTLFACFHAYLIYNNYTTIEYCEKKRSGQSAYQRSPFKITLK
jgi:hypothetical protein